MRFSEIIDGLLGRRYYFDPSRHIRLQYLLLTSKGLVWRDVDGAEWSAQLDKYDLMSEAWHEINDSDIERFKIYRKSWEIPSQ